LFRIGDTTTNLITNCTNFRLRRVRTFLKIDTLNTVGNWYTLTISGVPTPNDASSPMSFPTIFTSGGEVQKVSTTVVARSSNGDFNATMVSFSNAANTEYLVYNLVTGLNLANPLASVISVIPSSVSTTNTGPQYVEVGTNNYNTFFTFTRPSTLTGLGVSYNASITFTPAGDITNFMIMPTTLSVVTGQDSLRFTMGAKNGMVPGLFYITWTKSDNNQFGTQQAL
jgi:hypothetical protein